MPRQSEVGGDLAALGNAGPEGSRFAAPATAPSAARAGGAPLRIDDVACPARRRMEMRSELAMQCSYSMGELGGRQR